MLRQVNIMAVYTGKIKYDSDSIKKLYVARFNAFSFGRKVINFAVSAALILFGVYSGARGWGLIALAGGCLLLVNGNAVAQTQAYNFEQSLGGNYPEFIYGFDEASFSYNPQSERVPYSKIIKIVESGGLLFLFINKVSAFTVDPETVQGRSGSVGFRDFISAKTGLKWEKEKLFWNFSLKMLFPGSDRYGGDGPRLK